MKKGRIRKYWAWKFKGDKSPHPSSLSKSRKEVLRCWKQAGYGGKPVRVLLQEIA